MSLNPSLRVMATSGRTLVPCSLLVQACIDSTRKHMTRCGALALMAMHRSALRFATCLAVKPNFQGSPQGPGTCWLGPFRHSSGPPAALPAPCPPWAIGGLPVAARGVLSVLRAICVTIEQSYNRGICVLVTIEQSYNRGCTIARWLRKSLLDYTGTPR